MIDKALAVLEQLEKSSGRLEKEAILLANKDNYIL